MAFQMVDHPIIHHLDDDDDVAVVVRSYCRIVVAHAVVGPVVAVVAAAVGADDSQPYSYAAHPPHATYSLMNLISVNHHHCNHVVSPRPRCCLGS